MKLPLLALLFVGAASAVHLTPDVRRSFEEFRVRFNRTYTSQSELHTRMAIFADNFKMIEAHNSKPDIRYRMGINRFADYTEDEFKSFVSGYTNIVKPEPSMPVKHATKDIKDLPASVDWRDKGVITDVKDQGGCGSCWAFTTTMQIESYLKLSGDLEEDELKVLSPQQINSCTPNPLHCGGSGGCGGATTQIGFSYAQLFGIVQDSDYPYTSGNLGITGKCKFDAETMKRAAYIRGYETLPRNDVAVVMQHLAEVGPLGIAAAASQWMHYMDGVFNDCSYDDNLAINHAIQLVGYGTDYVDGDYWLVRNTWGAGWGEDGYIRLKRETTAVCGIDSTPYSGSACENDGSTVVKVCGMCGMLSDSSYPIGAGNVNTAIP